MQNAFALLGLTPSADEAAVRAAYRARVKECHPDRFQEVEAQQRAQDELIKLNLAYEEALHQCSQKRVGFNLLSQEDAKHFAMRLMQQGNMESALRQLCRADQRDDGWFYLQGNILMAMRQYETAHQSYREAVRRQPDNQCYRQGALDAALAMKKSQKLPQKAVQAIRGLFGKK